MDGRFVRHSLPGGGDCGRDVLLRAHISRGQEAYSNPELVMNWLSNLKNDRLMPGWDIAYTPRNPRRFAYGAGVGVAVGGTTSAWQPSQVILGSFG